MKRCCKCNTKKPLTKFYKYTRSKDGLQAACKVCMTLYQQEYRAKNPGVARSSNRRRSLTRKLAQYGVSYEDAKAILEEQGSRCRICRAKKKLVIDHDHETMEFRGFICSHCNTGLGMFFDSPDFLIAAARYLQDHTV